MSAKTSDGECKDCREDARFEEKNKHEAGNTSLSVDAHGASDKDHDHGHEQHENVAGLDEHEEASSSKTANGEKSLANSISIRGSCRADPSRFDCVFDELRRDTDLCADIAELSCNTEEELVLFTEWLLLVPSEIGALLSLKSHVCVCDFRDGREEEDDGKEEDECCYADICPLDL